MAYPSRLLNGEDDCEESAYEACPSHPLNGENDSKESAYEASPSRPLNGEDDAEESAYEACPLVASGRSSYFGFNPVNCLCALRPTHLEDDVLSDARDGIKDI